MNSLSWLIYLADALPSVGWALSRMAFVAFLLSVCLLMFSFDPNNTHNLRSARKFSVYAAVIAAPIALLAFAIPEQETFYLIAASEMGEQVIQTPEAQETFDRLKQLIDLQLDDLLADAKEASD